jgi:hypothetical protein
MEPNTWIRLIVAVGALLTMLVGIWLVFARLKAKNQGFGPNSLRSLGMVLFIPSLILLPLIVPDFGKETLAALLGTVAGYVLSQSRDSDEK